MIIKKTLLTSCALIWLSLMSACNPQFNWRDIHSNDAPFTILMPAKPDSFTQPILLAGSKLSMTMTACEVDQLSFAVGSTKLTDLGNASDILAAMQNGMIRNIEGKIIDQAAPPRTVMRVQGHQGNAEVTMAARFVSRGNWAYQLIVIGPPKKMTPEIVDTFMNSFVAN